MGFWRNAFCLELYPLLAAGIESTVKAIAVLGIAESPLFSRVRKPDVILVCRTDWFLIIFQQLELEGLFQDGPPVSSMRHFFPWHSHNADSADVPLSLRASDFGTDQ